MRSNGLRTWGLMAVVVVTAGPSVKSAEQDDGRMVNRTSVRVLSDVAPGSVAEPSPESVSTIALPQPIDASEMQARPGLGGVAAPPVGSMQVYGNDVDPATAYYAPGTNQRMADDLQLASGPCDAVYYHLEVYGAGTVGTFNVHTELWTGDPCLAGSTVIPRTAADFAGALAVPNDRGMHPLEVPLNPGIPIPGTVWLAATFSRNDAGWIVAGQAEIGSTQNLFSENDTDPDPDRCTLYNFTCSPLPCTPLYAGFWADVYCNAPTNGACCDGVDFESCTDTDAPGCPSGLFKPGMTCAANACGPSFEVYENSFRTDIFARVGAGRKWGDDLTLGAGAPCQAVAYELLMAAGQRCVGGRCAVTNDPCSVGLDCPVAPPFDAHVELWTNDDHGTPTVDTGDTPLAVIPGTARDFNGLAADRTTHRLLVGPLTGIQLPRKVWMVVTTSSDNAGPIFGGLADIGFSQDGFAIFGDHDNDPGTPFTWLPGFAFLPNGFNPTNCPFDPQNPTCVAAGSFRARVWCEGVPPTGACCNDVTGTCTDGVLPTSCEGRWMQDVTCASDPFVPSCGVHACCHPNPSTPRRSGVLT